MSTFQMKSRKHNRQPVFLSSWRQNGENWIFSRIDGVEIYWKKSMSIWLSADVKNKVSMRQPRLFVLLIRPPASIQPYRRYLNWVLYAFTSGSWHIVLIIWNCFAEFQVETFNQVSSNKLKFPGSQLIMTLWFEIEAKNLQLISVSEEFVLDTGFVSNSPPIHPLIESF